MLFAVLMDSNLVKAKGVWKALLYLPALTSVVISGTLFRLMFSEYDTGQMNVIVAVVRRRSDTVAQRKRNSDVCFAGIMLLEMDRSKYALFSVRIKRY